VATSELPRFFPYETPYENQREAMDRVREALTEGRDTLFEGACGTGKTLSALVPALNVAREQGKTVVITTNVHQQMRQFVAEARAIDERESLRAVVFKGKASMCHIDVGYEECQALRDGTKEVVELEEEKRELERREEDLLEASQAGDGEAAEDRAAVMDTLDEIEGELAERRENAVCERYYDNLTGDNEEFFAWLEAGVRTPEEIYQYAEEAGTCGYELLKEGLEGVDLVVCNYHHLVDPAVREQFFRWLGRDPEDVITVFDEAHNVEATAREHATRSLTETTLDGALAECDPEKADIEDPRAASATNVFGAFRDALVETYDGTLGFGERERLDGDWKDLAIANEEGRDDLTRAFLQRYSGQGIEADAEAALALGAALDREYDRAYRAGETQVRKECPTLQAAGFVESWLADGDTEGQHPVLSVRRDSAGGDEARGSASVYGRAELYACIPREVTEALFESVHASVLMSATLRPFDVVEDVLGLDDPATMAYGLSFPAANRRTFAVGTPALFARRRDDPDVQDTIAGTLADAIRFTPGNSLLFFPSYAEAERYHGLLSGRVDQQLYLDEPGVAVEGMRGEFAASEGAALRPSLWGTLTEGVRFDGEDAHAALVVGVPYPHLDDRLQAVQDAYEGAFADGSGWEYAVEIPTIRKTRQALGRVLRSPEEIGVRALLDERYTGRSRVDLGKYSVHDAFPAEERSELVDVAPEKLKYAMLNFFGDHDAYEGTPPEP
jgi:DNA excision repair protein ERCC-2